MVDEFALFQSFFKEMCLYYSSHQVLTYCNYDFLSKFINEKAELPNVSHQATMPSKDRVETSPQKAKSMIEITRDYFGITYQESIQAIWGFNAKGLNARAINAFYELIKNYLQKRDKQEIYHFHNSYDWFRVLYVLRQFTSHGGNIFSRGLEFPDRGKTLKNLINPYPDTITWQTISLTRGQKDEPQINEAQISLLLSHIMLFFTNNPDFNIGISNNRTLGKQECL